MTRLSLCLDIPNRSNLPLQFFLWLNVYFFAIWSLIYGFNILYKVSNFWNIQDLFVFAAYVTSNVFEFLRLYSAYSGNLKAKPVHLNRFLIITPLIILPILLFLLISAKDNNVLIPPLTYTLFSLMLLEFIFGVLAWKKFCVYQSQIYKLKREIFFQNAQVDVDQNSKNFI